MTKYTCPHCGSDLSYNGQLSGRAHYYCVSCDTSHSVSIYDAFNAGYTPTEYGDQYRTWSYNGEEI